MKKELRPIVEMLQPHHVANSKEEKKFVDSVVKGVAEMVQTKLQTKLIEMFTRPTPVTFEKVGTDLFICDTIYDVWPEDEERGLSALKIATIVQNKIRDYLRIHNDYEYINSEFNCFPNGQMRIVFHFQTLQLKPWDL